MSRRRSMRFFATVAFLAAVLMIFAPFAGLMPMTGPDDGARMSAMSDCDMCPKAGMVMANCAPALCGLPALEAIGFAPFAGAPVHYSAVFMTIPRGRYTIPPVSPG